VKPENIPTAKPYRLLGAGGEFYDSAEPGTLGGNGKARIYGRLDCGTARAALSRGYAAHRVFFADEAAAVAAGFRPCGNCMLQAYRAWKSSAGSA
jgi:hypothetical protein